MGKLLLINLAIQALLVTSTLAQDKYFPEGFSFGVATAAYQVEGGWNADGKGESIWDHLLHTNPGFIWDYSNGDVAADTYHHGPDDVQYLQAMGVTHYRMSISWSRILPDGLTEYVNEAGVAYYNRMFDALVAAGIQPMVTLYHWDLPNAIQDWGGFQNAEIANWFEAYARLCFERFGDRVKMWLTFNEPITTCRGGYEDGSSAPAIQNPGFGGYTCAHNLLRAHAKAYRAYDKDFRSWQGGRVSATIDTSWYDGLTQSPEDLQAAERQQIFNYEWWMTPIVEGDYPQLMRDVVNQHSAEEGLGYSRLPYFTEEEKNELRGSYDYFALNFYTSFLCTPAQPWGSAVSSYYRDVAVDVSQPDGWEGSGWLRVTPWGMRGILNWIKNRYGNPPLMITENGYADGGLEDWTRINYLRDYMASMLDAIVDDGCNVIGYTAWSFLDDFEWGGGYAPKFGMIHVNFDDDGRPRTRKLSSYIYENIIRTRHIDYNYNPSYPPTSWMANGTKLN